MAKKVQRRRGGTGPTAAFTGGDGEWTVDQDKKVVVVHDGVTPGGFPGLRADLANLARPIGGFVNQVINGAFNVDQYPSSSKSIGPGVSKHVCDRWRVTNSAGTSTATITDDTLTITAGASVTTITFRHRIHPYDSALGVSNRRALSFSLDTVSSETVTYSVNSANAYDSFAAVTSRATDTDSTGTALADYELLVPTHGDFINGTEIVISVANVNAGESVSLSLVQLEEVPLIGAWSTTPFERRPYGVELSMCETFYRVAGDAGTNSPAGLFSGMTVNGSYYLAFYQFPVEMRDIPAITLTNAMGTPAGFSTGIVGTVGGESVNGFVESRQADSTQDSSAFGSAYIANAEYA